MTRLVRFVVCIRRIVLAVGMLVLVASSVEAQSTDRVYRLLQGATVSAHVADLVTSVRCVQTVAGCREANPVLRWASDRPALYGATKIGLAGVQLWIVDRLYQERPRLATWVLVGSTVALTAIAVRNARQ